MRPARLLVLLATLAACSSTAPHDGPSGDLYMTGVVASLQHRATASGVLVEPLPDADDACGIQATADTCWVWWLSSRRHSPVSEAHSRSV